VKTKFSATVQTGISVHMEKLGCNRKKISLNVINKYIIYVSKRKANIGHILSRNFLLQEVIEENISNRKTWKKTFEATG
jgi:hypothetical protein